jgi:hypothetical protein
MAHQARDQQAGAVLGHQAQADEGHGQAGLVADEDEVAVQQHGGADAHGRAGDGGHHRLLAGFQRPHEAEDGGIGPAGGRCMKSSRSLPEVNTPGWPVISRARTAGSLPAATMASVMASYIAMVSAFFFSGRAISMVATPSTTPVRMVMRVSCF